MRFFSFLGCDGTPENVEHFDVTTNKFPNAVSTEYHIPPRAGVAQLNEVAFQLCKLHRLSPTFHPKCLAFCVYSP